MQDEFDKLFDAAFVEAAKRHTLAPSADSLWEKTESALRRRRTRRRRLRSLPLIAFSFIIGALLFSSPRVSDAFSPFFQKIKQWPDGIARVFIGSTTHKNTGAKTAPPPDFDANSAPESNPREGEVISISTSKSFSTWAEVEAYGYPAPDSEAVPEGFKLQRVEGTFGDVDSLDTATGLYQSEDSAPLSVMIHKMKQNEVGGSTYNEAEGKLEQVKVNGRMAYLFINIEGYASLEWRSGEYSMYLVGKVGREEILKLGESIK